ncbi:MAG: hypothetical protein AAFV80_17660 [Bacteroidota bacterium]
MDSTLIVAWIGFFLAAYSVVGNDVIQTLGTFLTSNEKRFPWYVLWAFAATILSATLIYGYLQADVAYGRLDKFEVPVELKWYYALPPLILMFVTRLGVPVSTTFMILTMFSLSDIVGSNVSEIIGAAFDFETKLGGMIKKSVFGYLIAFSSAIVIYVTVVHLLEKIFAKTDIDIKGDKSIWTNRSFWTIAQWFSTGLLWSQWLTQDLANIYVYLGIGKQAGEPLAISGVAFVFSLLIFLGLLAFIFYSKGGAVQDIVRRKTNTSDIRSATFVDLIYAIVLFIFKYNYLGLWEAKLPMSTTWVFIGLLAGREIGIRLRMEGGLTKATIKDITFDLGKVFLGLIISVALVILIKMLETV